jgi:uncharacterized membrane protein YqjE
METSESRGVPQGSTGQGRPGLIDGIVTVARDFASLAFNRLELAALELGEVRSALLKLLLIGALAIVAIWFAVAYWTVLVVYLAWESLGWKILLIIAILFSLFAWGLLRQARAMVEQGKLSMPATMAELRSDRDALL